MWVGGLFTLLQDKDEGIRFCDMQQLHTGYATLQQRHVAHLGRHSLLASEPPVQIWVLHLDHLLVLLQLDLIKLGKVGRRLPQQPATSVSVEKESVGGGDAPSYQA
jgi:hypothetical protein